MRLLGVAVVFSGGASLMYQVAWTRRLISMTSATAIAQALVLAIFMLGLGLGAWLAGRRSAKTPRPFRAYAIVEVAAAVLAAVSIPVIGESSIIPTMWLRLVVVGLFLLLPTTLLGASLPLVVEGVARNTTGEQPPKPSVGFLYGANTFGAAVGCYVAGFVGIEFWGLINTTLVGAVLALVAAGLAMSLPTGTAPSEQTGSSADAPGRSGVHLMPAKWLALAATAGFVGLGAEVAFTRLFASVVLNTVYAFTEVLLGVLIAIALGGFLAAAITRAAAKSDTPVQVTGRAAGVAQLGAAVLLALVPSIVLAATSWDRFQVDLARGTSLLPALLFVTAIAAPIALSAAVLPLLVEVAAGVRRAQALGSLYAANTFGSVVGSLAVGLWLLPTVGVHGSLAVLVGLSAIAGIVLLADASGKKDAIRIGALGTVTAAALLASYSLPRDLYESRLEEGEEILQLEESVHSDVMVSQKGTRRQLWINSAWVATAGAGTGFGHIFFGQLAPLLHAKPEKAVGIALGTGQTFAAIASNNMKRMDFVEINGAVVELSRRWFGEFNDKLLERDDVTMHVDDGRAFMRRADERYDLVVLEPLQAWTAGTSSLYSREFYEDAKRVLGPGGLVLQWIPFYGQGVEETKAMVRTGQAVFDSASLWLAGREGILILHKDPTTLDGRQLEQRISERGLTETFRRLGMNDGSDVLSYLALSPEGIRDWVGDSEVITDDRPFLEFAAARKMGRGIIADEIAESLMGAMDRDDLSSYVTATSTSSAVAIRTLRKVFVAAQAQVNKDARAKVYEAALEKFPNSNRLRLYYERHMIDWMRAMHAKRAGERELQNLRERTSKALARPPAN